MLVLIVSVIIQLAAPPCFSSSDHSGIIPSVCYCSTIVIREDHAIAVSGFDDVLVEGESRGAVHFLPIPSFCVAIGMVFYG
jgi:hypothetical protein